MNFAQLALLYTDFTQTLHLDFTQCSQAFRFTNDLQDFTNAHKYLQSLRFTNAHKTTILNIARYTHFTYNDINTHTII